MITKNKDQYRTQHQIFCTDDLVPQNHLLGFIERTIDWTFIYDLVEDQYFADTGRPNIDPVTLIKIPFIQYLYGIRSMRQTIKEIEVNVAYRWFLGLSLTDPAPHFSTFGKNYTCRFKGTDLFEQIFTRILGECFRCEFIDSKKIFVYSTNVKVCAINHKLIKKQAADKALLYVDPLQKEIDADREAHGKKPLKDKNDDGHGGSDSSGSARTQDGFFKQTEYVYDGFCACYICPNNQVLEYSTTNREGYREYKSKSYHCECCPYIEQCTHSQPHVKVVTCHLWEPYMGICEEIRQIIGMKDLYSLCKETIERIFGIAKEEHGFRYTTMRGKTLMQMKKQGWRTPV